MNAPSDWKNPTPTITEAGVDPAALAALAGNRLLLFSLPPRDIRVMAKGKLRAEPGAVFTGSALVVPVAAEEVRRRLLDFADYASLVPNTSSVEILERSAAHTRVAYVHTFRLSMLTLHTHITLQHTQESDGSLSAWLVEGDADAAVSRWQVIPLGAGRSLIVYLNWADVASRSLVLQMLLKAQPDLATVAPYGAAFVAMDALRTAFMPEMAAPAVEQLPAQPVVPAFPRLSQQPLLGWLAQSGPVVFIDAGQWLYRDGEVQRQRFVAVGGRVESPLPHAFQHSLRFENYPDFFPLARKVSCKARAEGFSVDWQVGVGLGFFSMGVHYRLAYTQPSPWTLSFHREDGDLAHIDGEWCWQPDGENHSLGALTISNHIGAKPSLVLRFARHLPHHDVLAGMYMGLMGMQRMASWLPCQESVLPTEGGAYETRRPQTVNSVTGISPSL